MSQSEFIQDLYEQLRDREFAAMYLSALVEENDPKALLLGLKDVFKANNMSIAEIARRINRNEKTLHRTLSRAGNPQLDTLNALLNATGYRISIVPDFSLQTSSQQKTSNV